MLTVADLVAMADDDRWLGHGYLGTRRNALDSSDPEATVDPAMVAKADQMAVDAANEKSLTRERLFEWANNKTGRWFGDCMFGGLGADMARPYAPGTRLH